MFWNYNVRRKTHNATALWNARKLDNHVVYF